MMSILSDFAGSLQAGPFYRDILARPTKKGWTYLIVLLLFAALILAISSGIKISGIFTKLETFYLSHNKVVEFVNGEIVNMPVTHKTLTYEDLTIEVDRAYTGVDSLPQAITEQAGTTLLIGPKSCFIVTERLPREIPYPATYTHKIDAAYIGDLKSKIVIASYIAGYVFWFIVKLIESLLYISLIIAPILLFKFRRVGLTYGEGFKVGLYLITYQLVLSTILMVLGITYIWIHLLFILMYLVIIGGLVNIDLSHSKRQLYATPDSE
jgi:hypothetical protein